MPETRRGHGIARIDWAYVERGKLHEPEWYVQQQRQLKQEVQRSLPYYQFAAEVQDMKHDLELRGPFSSHHSDGPILDARASYLVKKQWVKHGVWKDEWHDMPFGLWKHQKSIVFKSESVPDMQDEDKSRSTQRLVGYQREQEASRPFHRFLSQMVSYWDDFNSEVGFEDSRSMVESGIDGSFVYENIKSTWVKRGIWDRQWDKFPGIAWKHERYPDVVRSLCPDSFKPSSKSLFRREQTDAVQKTSCLSLAGPATSGLPRNKSQRKSQRKSIRSAPASIEASRVSKPFQTDSSSKLRKRQNIPLQKISFVTETGSAPKTTSQVGSRGQEPRTSNAPKLQESVQTTNAKRTRKDEAQETAPAKPESTMKRRKL